MKKKKFKLIIVTLIVLLFICVSNKIYATVSVSTDDKATAGKTATITVSVKNNENIGVVSGKIEHTSNITELVVEGKNNWNLTYNNDTGDFVIYKAEGASSEDIMKITVTFSNDIQDKATVKLSGLSETTITYISNNLADVTQEFSIEEVEKVEEETEDKKDQEQDSSNKEDTTKEENTTENNNNNKDETTTKKELPKTGTMGLVSAFVILIILGAIFYYKKNYYKGV